MRLERCKKPHLIKKVEHQKVNKFLEDQFNISFYTEQS